MKLNKDTVVRNLKNASSPWQTTLFVAITAFIYLYRAHPYFFKPQLYAEDGILWLADGHNKPVTALLRSDNGFFHFAEHLFGFIVIHLPLLWAPAIFAYTAWALFILMTYYLFSSRTKILTNNFERLFMVASLGLIANFNEFFFNFSNSVFLMGIIGALILVAKRPKNRILDVAEKVFFFLTCTTLLFSWIYLPLTLIDRFKYKTKNTFFLVVALLTSIAQGLCYILTHVNRSPITFLSLYSRYTMLELYNQIVIPAVRFARIDIPLAGFNTEHYPVLVVYLTVIAVLVGALVVLRRGNKQVWYLLFFLVAMTLASVKSPTISVKSPIEALQIMSGTKDGNRYFVYGIVAVNLVLAKSAYLAMTQRARYTFLGFFIAFGLITSIHYKAFYVDKGWRDYTADYRRGIEAWESPKVTHQVIIPVNPYPWTMALGKP